MGSWWRVSWAVFASSVMFLRLTLGAALVCGTATAQSVPSWAQPAAPVANEAPIVRSDESSSGGPGLPDDPVLVPIDGGLGFLLLAGGALAASGLRRRNR